MTRAWQVVGVATVTGRSTWLLAVSVSKVVLVMIAVLIKTAPLAAVELTCAVRVMTPVWPGARLCTCQPKMGEPMIWLMVAPLLITLKTVTVGTGAISATATA